MTGFRSKGRGQEICGLTDSRTDTTDQATFSETLSDIGNRPHHLLHTVQGIGNLGVPHLVKHIGKFTSRIGCSPADRTDCAGHLFGSFRTFEFGKAFLKCLEDVLPLIIASLAGIEQFIKGFFQLFKFCRTFLYVFQLIRRDERDTFRISLAG